MTEPNENRAKNPRSEKAEVELPGGYDPGSLVCRVPALDDWDIYLHSARKNGTNVAAKELILRCQEGLSDEQCEKVFEDFPALPEALADSLEDLAGGDLECENTMDAITVIVSKKESYTFHAPTQPDHDAMNKAMKSGKEKPGPVMRTFLKRCHSGDGLDSFFERYPSSIGPITAALRGIAGASFEVRVKKG